MIDIVSSNVITPIWSFRSIYKLHGLFISLTFIFLLLQYPLWYDNHFLKMNLTAVNFYTNRKDNVLFGYIKPVISLSQLHIDSQIKFLNGSLEEFASVLFGQWVMIENF